MAPTRIDGRMLRYAVLVMLHDRRAPMTILELATRLSANGFVVPGREARRDGKYISDAL